MQNSVFRMTRLYCFFVVCLLFFSPVAFAQKAVPELWGQRVHDEVHILKQATIDELEKKLKTYEDSTSNQIAILIIQSLDGEVMERYSMRVVEKWKLGQKGKDNGVLLLIAYDDHKVRIEVGQGLEGVLTDLRSSTIVRNEIAPAFRRGDYDAGVTLGVNSIIGEIGGEFKASEKRDNTIGIGIAIIVGLVFLIVLILAFVKEYRSAENPPQLVVPTRKKNLVKKGKGKVGAPLVIPSLLGNIGSGSVSSSRSSSSGGSFTGGGGNFGGGGASGSW